jgi:hypothetical protein
MRTDGRAADKKTGPVPPQWEAVAALLALTVAYALVSAGLRLGPVWLFPLLVVVLLVPLILTRRRGRADLSHRFGLALAALALAAVGGSVAMLLVRLLRHEELPATALLRDGAILWASNVVVFAMWYWELDGGGPGHRHLSGYRPTDFLFPQTTIGEELAREWSPRFVDYLFVAFTASSAFGPTDTSALSGRAKLLMMTQVLMSIVTAAVFVARAVNILG